jgi:hypothetical protein
MSGMSLPTPPPLPPPLPGPLPVRPIFLEPPRPSRRRLVVGVAAIGIAVAIVLGFAGVRIYKLRALPERESLSIGQKHQETKEAFTGGGPAANDQEARAISAALDQVNAAIQKQNTSAMAAVFDSDRMCDELDRLGAFSSVPFQQRAQMRSGLGTGFAQGLVSARTGLGWTGHRVKKISLSDSRREAVVYDLEYRGIGTSRYTVKMRWWMRKSGGQWKVWDMEALEEGIRATTIMSSMMASAVSTGVMPVVAQAGPLIKSVSADLLNGNVKSAETNLKLLDAMALPNEFVAIRHVLWSALHTRQSNFDAALADCDAAEATGLDVPVVHQLRTMAYNRKGKYAKALDSAGKWEESLGGDSELYYERGTALSKLQRPVEAAKAFGQSLDEDSEAAGSLAELSHALPPGRKGELATRFAQCSDPTTMFRNAMPLVQQTRDLDGMGALIDAYRGRRESANDAWLTYYDGELKIMRKQYKAGELLLKSLVPEAEKIRQEDFLNEYVSAAMLAGDSIEAYDFRSDKRAVFKDLASQLLSRKDTAMISRLAAMHVRAFPDDPWAYYYQAKVSQAAADYDAADASYEKASSLASDKDLDTIRYSRVDARYAADRGLSAYQDIGPKDKVFLQLANKFSLAKQSGDLAKLVAARRTDSPEDPTVPLWDAQAKFLAGDYAGTVEVLTRARETIEKNKADQYGRFTEILLRSEIRLKDFDAARAEASRSGNGDKSHWRIALIECAAGNAAEGTKALDFLLANDDYEAGDFYVDPDIGPALGTPAFAVWRAKHPMPVTRPATQPTVDSDDDAP